MSCNTTCSSCQNTCGNCNNACQNNCAWDGCWGFYPPWHGCWDGCGWGSWNDCEYSRWRHPITCTPAYYSYAGSEDGPTLVIHQISLEVGGEQSCTPRTFKVRITGPSYPCGEIFSLRAGSCLELDEPLVISGLEPGQYRIETVYDNPRQYCSTITGAACGGVVTITDSTVPTVVTIVSRRRLCRRGCGHQGGCSHGCGCNSGCNSGCSCGC